MISKNEGCVDHLALYVEQMWWMLVMKLKMTCIGEMLNVTAVAFVVQVKRGRRCSTRGRERRRGRKMRGGREQGSPRKGG